MANVCGFEWLLLLTVLQAFIMMHCMARPANKEYRKYTKHMTDCEKSLYTTCVLKLATTENLIDNCDATDLIECLNKHLTIDICKSKDEETLPTIATLLREVSRRFKEKKACANEKFIERIKDHFLVQAQNMEMTNSDDEVGSGSGVDVDDSEVGDDDADAVEKFRPNKQEDGKPHVSNSAIDQEVQTWKERGRKKIRNKQWMRMAVFFDDPSHSRRNSERNSRKEQTRVMAKNQRPDAAIRSLNRAWQKLKDEYVEWFSRVKKYQASGT